MTLRIFPIAGEALNFGLRRIETIAKVAWLPVALLLTFNMTAVFAYLSVIAGRAITFSDIGTFATAEQLLDLYANRGWAQNPEMMGLITAVIIILSIILIASFLVPLIRYAGLGEEPVGGMRAAFGANQLRFVFAGLFSITFIFGVVILPALSLSYYAMDYFIGAVSQTMAYFPDENSLHRIEILTAEEGLAKRQYGWMRLLAAPGVVAAPIITVILILAYRHFHPKNRNSGEGVANPILRGVVVFAGAISLAGLIGYILIAPLRALYRGQGSDLSNAAAVIENMPESAFIAAAVGLVLLVWYFNLRLFAYPGIAVCNQSLMLRGTLHVTRGFNLFRLQIIILLVVGVLLLAQVFIINALLLNYVIPQTVGLLYQAVSVSSRLVNSGVESGWVLPLFVWIWNGAKIVVNVFWIFFSYGVIAGLYGILYRFTATAR